MVLMLDGGREEKKFVRCVDVIWCADAMSDCTVNVVFGGRCKEGKAL